MFQYLDDSLQRLLTRTLSADLSEQVDISFATPDEQFQPLSSDKPTINLFLYDIRENLELRSQEWVYQSRTRNQGSKSIKPYSNKIAPPVRVDCSYLITTWSSQTGSQIRDEHHVLGAVMQALLKYRTLPTEFLAESLQDQALPLPTATLQASQLQSFSEFWQALGGKPKAALNYTVTISVPRSAPVELAHPVEEGGRELVIKHARPGENSSNE